MNLWRRFVRWLADDYIDQAMEAGRMQEQLVANMGRVLERNTAYLKGYTEGTDQAYEAIEAVVRERTGRLEAATLEDVRISKKWRLH